MVTDHSLGSQHASLVVDGIVKGLDRGWYYQDRLNSLNRGWYYEMLIISIQIIKVRLPDAVARGASVTGALATGNSTTIVLNIRSIVKAAYLVKRQQERTLRLR